MHAATSIIFLTFLGFVSPDFSRAELTTAPTTAFPGPCRPWLFPCGKGSWVCTSEAAYWSFIFGPKPDCPSQYPQTTAPPPGDCQLVNGVCQFTESMLKCKTWVDQLSGNKCGSVTEYVAFTKSYGAVVPKGFGQYPPPNQLCLPENGSCRWYDPCVSWREFCTKDSVCGSADEYYAFVYGPHPSCNVVPPGHIPTGPPGQCAIDNDHCDWYDCTSWLSWCDDNWNCGTTYDKDTYLAGPPPPCPPPPPNHHPPVKPGTCRFNISSGQCSFYPNHTECVSWLGMCEAGWLCGTVHEREIYHTIPPPPCPLPPHPPVQPGTCKFNSSAGKCSFFPNTSNPCNQPIYPQGYKPTCGMLEQKWTYNSSVGQCVAFAYSPCGEDREGYDVFSTQEECLKTCVHQDPCNQPIYPPGFIPRCNVLKKQWTYNSTTGQCVEFYYHPCGEDRDGYDVFDSEEECTKICLHRDPCKESIYPPGFIPKCTVLQKQWTYNQTSRECVEFGYHPCGEDRDGYDVFTSEFECIRTCVHQDPCHQPIYPPGFKPSCRLLIKQWTYSPKSGQCVEFEYYPCGEERDGYDVFSTEKECISTCVNKDL